jgi:TfoX/Sxy family transcriptional regulator of competence genes
MISRTRAAARQLASRERRRVKGAEVGPSTRCRVHVLVCNSFRVAYDEDLADRLRELLAGESGITEKKMFGGLAFLLHGHMTVSASRTGGLLVRIDPAATEAALARPHAALMNMRGRTMEGWIIVAPEGLTTKRQLASWVSRSVAYAETLPPK